VVCSAHGSYGLAADGLLVCRLAAKLLAFHAPASGPPAPTVARLLPGLEEVVVVAAGGSHCAFLTAGSASPGR
jgi:hypothetical protein